MASRRRTNVAGVTGALCLARPVTVRRRSRSDDDTAGPNSAKANGRNADRPVVCLLEEAFRACDASARRIPVTRHSVSTYESCASVMNSPVLVIGIALGTSAERYHRLSS